MELTEKQKQIVLEESNKDNVTVDLITQFAEYFEEDEWDDAFQDIMKISQHSFYRGMQVARRLQEENALPVIEY